MTTIANTMVATNKGQRTFQSVAAFARMANATPYTAGDSVGTDSAETASAILFPGCGPAGTIKRVRLCIDEVDTMSFSLLLFDAEPTNFLDNAPLALVDSDIEKLIGRWDFADTSKLLVEIGGTWTSFRPTLDYDALEVGARREPLGQRPAVDAHIFVALLCRHTAHLEEVSGKLRCVVLPVHTAPE